MRLDKCIRVTLRSGKLVSIEKSARNIDREIRVLYTSCLYKYLGTDELSQIQHTEMKNKFRREYFRSVGQELNKEINAKTMIIGIKFLAILGIHYSYNIINWKISEMRNLDRNNTNLLTANRKHYHR